MRKIAKGEKKVFKDFYIGNGTTLLDIQDQFDRFINDNNVIDDTVEIEGYGWSENDGFSLVGIREETLAEKARRETAERRKRVRAGQRKAAKEAEERKDYERLKKKYGES